MDGAIKDVKLNYNERKIIPVNYRPFDTRYTFYTGNSMGYMGRPKGDLGVHLNNDNLSLVTVKKSRSNTRWNVIGISNKMICEPTTITSLDGNYGFPLYIYPKNSNQQLLDTTNTRIHNIKEEIINLFSKNLNLEFTSEKESNIDAFSPIDILDYTFAILNSTRYCIKNDVFLKIDFPRVPAPLDHETFWQLVKLGSELRQIHLLESPTVEKYITQYPEDGDNVVRKPRLDLTGFENLSGLGNVYINETQYFANVPEVAWNFYIGGYQPCQKWLKDRKDRELSYEDILHYQKIVVALSETDRIMKEIDGINLG